jgi:hypothetical protein
VVVVMHRSLLWIFEEEEGLSGDTVAWGGKAMDVVEQ